MARIIAGRFQTKEAADAVAALLTEYIDSTDICIFHNNPPGQHGAYVAGGDEVVDPSSEGAGQTTAGVSVAAGLTAGALGALGGPAVALAAAATGAYTGSLAGALHGLGSDEYKQRVPEQRAGGIFLSVRIEDPINEQRVIATLRSEGAVDIEHAEGEWHNGDWTDFNPVAAPQLIEGPAP